MKIVAKIIPFLFLIVILVIISCSDSLDKSTSIDDVVRIEYSKCSGLGCLECLTKFHCPENAIKTDERTGINYIDTDLCVQCMECSNIFQCPEGAIVTQPDLIGPPPISNLHVNSNEVGTIEIDFIAAGDDSTRTGLGKSYQYDFQITDLQGTNILTNFIPPVPLKAGTPEIWNPIDSLPPGETLTIHITAYDEAGNSSPQVTAEVLVMDYPDEIAPAAISDLNINANSISMNVFTLNWTAVGDDDLVGTANSYIIKIHTQTINENNWDDIPEYQQNLVPLPVGNSETITIAGLNSLTDYFATVKAVDEVGNTAELSNIVNAQTTAIPDTEPPAAIDDLTASASETTVELSWTAPGDDGNNGTAFSYEIRYSENEITSANWEDADLITDAPLPQIAGTLQGYIFTAPELNTTYYFGIKSTDENQNISELSNIAYVTFIGDQIAPAAISDLNINANSISMNAFTLNWTAVGDDDLIGTASSYIIKIHTETINENNWDDILEYQQNLVPLPVGNSETITITGLNSLTDYFAAVKAVDEVGNTAELSNIVNAQTTAIPDTEPPAAIDDLTASASETTVELSWTAPGDDGNNGTAFSYEIRYSENEITSANWEDADLITDAPLPQIAGTLQGYIFTAPELNKTYYFGIKSADENQNISELSNIVNAICLGDQTPPAAVSDLSTDAVETTIDLSWTAPGDDGNTGTAFEYVLKYSENEITNSNWDEATTIIDPPTPQIAGTVQNYNFTVPQFNVTYYFGIKSSDENQNMSELSNIANAVCWEDVEPPAAIDDLTATATETIIELAWTAPGDDGMTGIADHYEIKMHEEEITETNWADAELLPGPPWPLAAGSLQNYTVTNLEYNQTYFFAIKAFDDNSNISEVSNSPAAILLNDIVPPADITDLSVNAGYASNLSTIKIQWTAPGDDGSNGTCDHYEIRYATVPIDENTWDFATVYNDPPDPQIAGSNQFCDVSGLTSATIYYFAIKAFDEMGNDNNVSNSPAGKLVYQINTGACHNCNNHCISDCTHGAILQGPGYKYIDPDACTACGDCSCPWSLIYPAVVAY